MIRLFLKEHAIFILFQLFLVLFVMLLYWLDGFRNLDTAIYSIVISFILTVTFLTTLFLKKAAFYKKILSVPTQVEGILQREAHSPEIRQIEVYLEHLYRLYQRELQLLYARQNRHLQFMNNWVHQMKTPISILELMAQDRDKVDAKSLLEETDRLKRGLDAVLMNARLDTFEEDMQIDKVNLKELVTEAVSKNKRLFIGNRIYPVIDIEEEIYITTDAKWLGMIISQFITNAIKYTLEDNKKLYFEAKKEHHSILFSVRDEGMGIPASDIKRVTKPFFTGENGRKIGESTGIGLYLAQEVCSRLNHELLIESAIGEGTTVSICFQQQESNERGEHDDDSNA